MTNGGTSSGPGKPTAGNVVAFSAGTAADQKAGVPSLVTILFADHFVLHSFLSLH